MQEETDDMHRLTMPQLIARLDAYGIEAQRKSIHDDLDALNDAQKVCTLLEQYFFWLDKLLPVPAGRRFFIMKRRALFYCWIDFPAILGHKPRGMRKTKTAIAPHPGFAMAVFIFEYRKIYTQICFRQQDVKLLFGEDNYIQSRRGRLRHIGPWYTVRIRRNRSMIGTLSRGEMWASPPTMDGGTGDGGFDLIKEATSFWTGGSNTPQECCIKIGSNPSQP